MKDETIKKLAAELGSRGGKRNTEAQQEARKQNAEKARKAKELKRATKI